MNALQVWEAVGALGILSNRGSSSSSGGNGSGSHCTGTEAAIAEADPTLAAPSEAPVDVDMTEVAAAVEILKTAPAAVNGAIDKAAPRARKKTAHSRKKAALGAVARTSISAVEAHAGATAAPNWSPKAEELPPAAQAPDSSNPNTRGGKAKTCVRFDSISIMMTTTTIAKRCGGCRFHVPNKCTKTGRRDQN